jgi:hypothetical protein
VILSLWLHYKFWGFWGGGEKTHYFWLNYLSDDLATLATSQNWGKPKKKNPKTLKPQNPKTLLQLVMLSSQECIKKT